MVRVYGVGLTDMCKVASGSDAALRSAADDPEAVARKVRWAAPKVLAFNGKRAAKVFFREILNATPGAYGLQEQTLGETALFVLPSTSGAANRWWNETPWYALAAYLGRRKI